MATPQNDGSIILSTKVDEKGLKTGINDIKNATSSASKNIKDLGAELSKALGSGDTKSAQLISNFKKASEAVEEQTKKVQDLKDKLEGLESGNVEIKDAGVEKMQKDFDKATSSAQNTQNEINKLYVQLDQLQNNAFRAPDTGEIVLTEKEKALFDETVRKIEELENQLALSKQKADELGDSLQKAAGIKTQEAIEKTKTELAKAEAKLGDLTTKAEISGQKMNRNMRSYRKEVTSANKAVNSLGKRIGRLAMGALVFSAITKMFTELRKTISSMLMSNEAFRKSVNMLKASLWTVSQPIYEAALPALKTLIYWLTKGLLYVAAFFSAMSGKTLEQTMESAKALNTQADAFEKLTTSSKKAEKQLASFDDISILREGAVVSDLGGINAAFEDLKSLLNDADFQNLKAFEQWVGENKDSIKTALEIAGLGALGIAIGKTITKIGSLLGWFKKKDAGLDRQTQKTRLETEAVTAWSTALAFVPGILAGLVPALNKLTDWGIKTTPVLNGATASINELTPAVEGVADSVATSASTMESTWFTSWDKIVDKTKETISEIVKLFSVGGEQLDVQMNPALENVQQNVSAFADNSQMTLKGWAQNAAQNVASTASVFADNMRESFKVTDSNVGEFARTTSDNVKQWGTNITENTKESAVTMLQNFTASLLEMWIKFKTFQKLTTGEEPKGTFSTKTPSWKTATMVGLGAIASAVLMGLTGIPIPMLAKGGIVPHATTAIIGERGREAVLPLENHTEWMDELADKIAARNSQNSSGNTTVVLEIDGREFGHAVIEQGQRENRRLGTRWVMA